MLKFLLPKIVLALFIPVMLLVACSPSGGQNEQPTSAPPATLTTIPFYNFVQPTLPPQMQTLAAATAAAGNSSGSSTAVSNPGQTIYTTLACNSCHGDKGEGVTDKGKALTSFSMSQDDFVSFLRSGGTVGSTHIYSTDKLSDDDAKVLYTFLQSLVTK